MRADRLITIVLLLQHRREMTAGEFADELGVSVRTIYRDIEALCEIGIPIYADRGATGGYRLVEDYRSDLNGLTRDERSALNLLDLPEPLADLAIGRQLRNALLKLYAVQAPGRQPAPDLNPQPTCSDCTMPLSGTAGFDCVTGCGAFSSSKWTPHLTDWFSVATRGFSFAKPMGACATSRSAS